MSSRRIEPSDLPIVRSKLLGMLSKSPAPQMKHADINVAMSYIGQAMRDDRAWLVGGYLVLYDVGSDWYTDKQYLIEQLIIRLYDTPEAVGVAISFLDERASLLGCDAIAVGDTQVGYMTPKYLAAGYTVLGIQLYKEIIWDFFAS